MDTVLDKVWEVYALKYAERSDRTRGESFIFDDHSNKDHTIDYFIWVLKSDESVIVVDTGYDYDEAKRRNRPIQRSPSEALKALDIEANQVTDVIITHLHYDHAGGLKEFPNAKFHLQESEMAYATGPCMCHETIKMPFTGEHVCQMVKKLYSGRVVFYNGFGAIRPGVTTHLIGGHSRGLQSVRVKTNSGYMCLASDATHFYENFLSGKPFPIVVDLEDMLNGFKIIKGLASDIKLVIPGHDPLLKDYFPEEGVSGFVWRLDKGPINPIKM
jgi:glyoxylase-like metal-dependent hydrolase (beta-lactamase superfamily II)